MFSNQIDISRQISMNCAVSKWYIELRVLNQIWREISIWLENTFLVVQADRLENSLLPQIWREMSILDRKHKILCIT